jgi:hypothetical protein
MGPGQRLQAIALDGSGRHLTLRSVPGTAQRAIPTYLENWFWKGCKPNSVCALRRRESFVLATDTRSPSRFHGTRSEPLRGFLFGLAPDGVCRAALLALRAVRSYRTFSPLPPQTDGGGLIFCGTFRRQTFRFAARVYPGRTGPGYAASRSLVFGLSSPGLRTGAILRPSKTVDIVVELGRFLKLHRGGPAGASGKSFAGNRQSPLGQPYNN